jgi:lipopolysaccharide/colanic/teichoic acid biosynthesis glycosyltransferase
MRTDVITKQPLRPSAIGVLPEPAFLGALCLERKRAERSRNPFILMLIEVRESRERIDAAGLLHKAAPAIRGSIRETDIAGWYKERLRLGVVFTDLGAQEKAVIVTALRTRMLAALRALLPAEEVERLSVTFYHFPDDWKADDPTQSLKHLYPDVVERDDARRTARLLKRGIDLFGAFLALIIFAPLLLVLALAIKLTSPGPVLFRQKRVGQYGTQFTCLKLRSMHAVNDARIHKEYVTRFITGRVETQLPEGNGKVVYKLTKDPRLTRMGRLLRKTSFDELPQLFNVLRGEMSLVGPRPPIPYELDAYDLWHRRRLLDVKPGITGLWQVSGRSRLRFDDMVRLDLRYATAWSVWLDIKILFRTPYAVFSGEGAH